MAAVLDTHAAIGYLFNRKRLSEDALRFIRRALDSGKPIYISAISQKRERQAHPGWQKHQPRTNIASLGRRNEQEALELAVVGWIRRGPLGPDCLRGIFYQNARHSMGQSGAVHRFRGVAGIRITPRFWPTRILSRTGCGPHLGRIQRPDTSLVCFFYPRSPKTFRSRS